MKKQFMMIGFFLVAMLAGCSHDESTQAVDSRQTNVSAEFVSADEAKTIAAAVQFGSAETGATGSQATTRSASLDKKAVLNVTPVADAAGSTAFYVINYEGGGFMILSADKRMDPVLAYSETSTFPMNDPKGLPGGLVDWMTETKAYVQDIRMKDLPLTERMAAAWEPSSINQMIALGNPQEPIGEQPIDDDCESESKTYGPLLMTAWHQEPDFNGLAPFGSCSQLSNGRAYAGCVAVAMAQVMKYYRFPGRYNWNNMPNSYATHETAKLIRDIGDAVEMDYHCSHSSSDLKKAAKAFTRSFQYKGAIYKGSIDMDIVRREIINGRPVLMGGNYYKSPFNYPGHVWVCDGYKYSMFYYYKCEGYLYEWFSRNWGWGKAKYDGWYTSGDLNSHGGNHYSLMDEMVYGIVSY